MAAYDLYSHSPQVCGAAAPQDHMLGPTTPIHSPHHSVHSSASLRTPVHTLSIHEYRKQQSTPSSRISTPLGKTLRRKAAASALNELERAPCTKLSLPRDSLSAARPLHSSYSAHQLAPQSRDPGFLSVSDQIHRSQSADPQAQSGKLPSLATVSSNDRTRQFSSRKRLPRPSASTGPELHSPSYASVRSAQQVRATLPAHLSYLTEASVADDVQTTPTPSTFSLSRFPQPPHFETLREAQRENSVSCTTTALTTPPATPATIHYRGASFDLVNPHASLQYHNIVTPSRDFDSSELLPFRSLQESLLDCSEMAPRRPLYGDLNAAHAGIVRHAENSYSLSTLDLPLPPTPAAISPPSSTYSSPVYSPESHFSPSPLAVRKAADESRFSIKQLTRTLTKRLTKTPERGQKEELQQFQESGIGRLSISADEAYLRPLEQTYMPAERSLYFPISPISPTSPISPASFHDLESISGDDENEIEHTRKKYGRRDDSPALTSMIPDDPSSQIGRGETLRTSVCVTDQGARPYYDDLTSIYACSSVYTEDDHRRSAYQHSVADNRKTNDPLCYSGIEAAGMASEYSYDSLEKSSQPVARPTVQDSYHFSVAQGDGKTDTISKFIDQYDPGDTTANSLFTQDLDSADTSCLIAPYTSDVYEDLPERHSQAAAYLSGLSQFEFDSDSRGQLEDVDDISSDAQWKLTIERLPNCQLGQRPLGSAPLAPAFQYDRIPYAIHRPELSEIFSNGSYTSYGDTRNLLRISLSETGEPSMPMQYSRPLSSKSQPEAKAPKLPSSSIQTQCQTGPHTPQAALDQAELIFDNAATGSQPGHEDIPAMWGGRSSLNLFRSRRLTDGSVRTAGEEKADWETLTGESQHDRLSLDSIADYSSSEGGRKSFVEATAKSLPPETKPGRAHRLSNYVHPSPLRIHTHPFSSSPPRLTLRAGSHSAADASASGTSSSPPASTIVPVLRFSTQFKHAVDEPYAFTPWADPYALSDRETQELLASGPNDDILFDSEVNLRSRRVSYKFRSHEKLPKGSPPREADNDECLQRENTFDKITVLGPKSNLTGTPGGTGMHDAGSSIADSSSSGARLGLSVSPRSPRSDYNGFYASPFPATGSETRIRQSRSAAENQHERITSQVTLFPNAYSMEPVQGSSPLAGPDRRQSTRYSTTFKPARRTSRAAVPGQTKLRQMVLAPDARTTISSQDTHFSRFVSINGSRRPSTSDTATPLHATHPSLDTFRTARGGNTVSAHQHSPHLLYPDREVKEEDERRRRKLSWLIFTGFCILPPCIFLYRVWGDTIIASVTKGDLGHCTAKSKRAALIAGIVVNIGLITAILVPILVAQALKAI